MYYVYLIECKDGTIYTGITTDVERRFKEHSSGRGGAYTQTKKVKKLLYTEECKNRSAALKRESEIKSWPREKKLDLVKKEKNKVFRGRL
jgi:putative endonuclease